MSLFTPPRTALAARLSELAEYHDGMVKLYGPFHREAAHHIRLACAKLTDIEEDLDEGIKGMRVLADVLRAINCKRGAQQAADWADRMTERLPIGDSAKSVDNASVSAAVGTDTSPQDSKESIISAARASLIDQVLQIVRRQNIPGHSVVTPILDTIEREIAALQGDPHVPEP